MKKFVRRILCLGLILVSFWCLVELNDAIWEPVVAEKRARQFLQATPFTLQQFDEVEIRRSGDFNSYSWRFQNGEELLELEVVDGEACLNFIGEPDRRDICEEIKRNVNLFIECVRLPGDPYLIISCRCVTPINFVEVKRMPT